MRRRGRPSRASTNPRDASPLKCVSCSRATASSSLSSSWSWQPSAEPSRWGSRPSSQISVEAKTVPAESPGVAAVGPAAAPPTSVAIDAPGGLPVRTAVAELEDAVADAFADVAATSGRLAVIARHRDGEAGDDSYRLIGSPRRLRIDAGSEAGAARGLHDLALAVREGRDPAERLGETVTSRLPFRMVDLGAAGVTADPAQWRSGTDYSHHSQAFEDVILDDAPYVDQQRSSRPGTTSRNTSSTRSPRDTTPSRSPGSSSTSPSTRSVTGTRSTPTATSTSPAPRRCARRSARSGSTRTTSACRSTCAPTCWR